MSTASSYRTSLNPNYIQIDERSIRDRLTFAAEYTKLINFYDRQNKKNGNWSDFFLKDPVILLAKISKENYKKTHQLFSSVFGLLINGNERSNSSVALGISLSKIYNLIDEIFKNVNDWYEIMDQNDESYQLKLYVIHEIKYGSAGKVFWKLNALQQYLSSTFKSFEPKRLKSTYRYDKIWDTQRSNFDVRESIFNEKKQFDYTLFTSFLKKEYDQLFTFYVQIIESSKNEFKLLTQNFKHYPDTALYISFVKLMEIHKKEINTFTKKHLDFYYLDILKMSPNTAVPDYAYIIHEIDEKVDQLNLESGTRYKVSNPKDKTQFQTTKNQTLNSITIKTAKTLFNGELLESEKPCYHLNEIKNPTQVQKDDKGFIKSWDMFGNSNGTLVHEYFVLSSPMFYLSGGIRTVTIVFDFDKDIDIEKLKNSSISFSTGTKWLEILNNEIDSTIKWFINPASGNKSSVTLEIVLQKIIPPIKAFAKPFENINSFWPSLKIVLNTNEFLVEQPSILGLDITTVVTDLEDVQLYNDHGALSKNSLFMIFGPIVEKGNNFYLASSEIFSKPCIKYSFEIDWADLPTSFSEYYSAYNEYINTINEKNPNSYDEFKQDVFKVFFLSLNDGEWKDPVNPSLKNTTEFELFGANNTTTFSADNISKDIIPNENLQLKPIKFLTGLSGFVKLNLSSPIQGFGSELYTKIVEKVSLENAEKLVYKTTQSTSVLDSIKSVLGTINTTLTDILSKLNSMISNLISIKKEIKEIQTEQGKIEDLINTSFIKFNDLPNIPLIPKVKRLSTTYTAHTVLNFNNQAETYPFDFYQNNCFSTYKISDQLNPLGTKSIGDFKLFPTFMNNLNNSNIYQGNLYIALEKVKAPSFLSLLFELNEQQNLSSSIAKLYCLTKDSWEEVKPLSDSTNNFRTSGIIEFQIPESISNNSILMGDNNYWIKFSVESGANNFCKVVNINTQAVKVTRVINQDINSLTSLKINSGTISGTENKVEAIKSVHQVNDSLNGVVAEDMMTFYERVSSRINTKNRIITLSDFENAVYKTEESVFYCKVTRNEDKVSINLVKAYTDEFIPSAFRPFINCQIQKKITDYIKTKTSGNTQFVCQNFQQEILLIEAELDFKPTDNVNLLCQTISSELKLFLSPWIKSSIKQIKIDSGISLKNVSDFFYSFPEVSDVIEIYISRVTENKRSNFYCYQDVIRLKGNAEDDVIYPSENNRLFVSADSHHVFPKGRI